MQNSSILCCSSNSLYFSTSQLCRLLPGKQINSGPNFSFSSKLPWTSLHLRLASRINIRSASTQELVETTSGFVETGYIYGVHGFQGEVQVKLTTDFPELRFSKPGTRWLKQQMSGTETLQEIELVEGRGHPGQSWIVRFNDINTVEQAQKLVGSTILVTDEDRPVLEEGEFYTHDLIGMRVILKESGEPVGTVVNVFNSGASDLLHVKLTSSKYTPEHVKKSEIAGSDSGPLVWVPFVEAIVPTVDLEKREMLITPPKGLLELNIRSDERSKKERRELVCKVNPKRDNRNALLGLVDSCKANVGIRLFKHSTYEEDFDVVLSMSFLRKLVKQINKLQFQAVLSSNSYIEKVDKDWIDVIPTSPNSYEFRCSIYSCLNATPINKVCILDSIDS
ncbi:hypothetical protein CDL12_13553 [Handroanthus impetiginosus]|uniref:16S rRNA processing protein RimM n=1 Tax=Handroanthus impetiginosus TaxID=429701 RepID=A0A2G9H8I1_9LAMI|nr:hypothetical protein CDL12_13553 [Handroanthus impetiginosus]